VQRKIRVFLFWSVIAAIFFPTGAFANSPMPPFPLVLLYVPAILLLLLAMSVTALVIWVRIRWREIGTPSSKKTMLHESDFKSVWDIAHLWAGYARGADGTELSEPVLDKLQKLIWAFARKQISLRTRSGNRVPNEAMYLFLFDLNKPRAQLFEMRAQQRYDEAMLDSLFVMRSEVLKWCKEDDLTPPAIWAPGAKTAGGAEGQNVVVGRHREEAIDKQRCQAIAQALWDIDPQIHPAHMINHKAIQKYGNAGQYEDPDTIRSWIVEVDPLRRERKPGRPPSVRYILDLDNGGLSKDWLAALNNK
jgi:hypothetical protein